MLGEIKTFSQCSKEGNSNTQTIRGNLRTNYLSEFDHFIELALKGFIGVRLATPVTLPSFYDNLVVQPQIKLDNS